MVSTIDHRPVGELVAERPSRATVFEALAIDYGCHGSLPLDEACAARQIKLRKILQALRVDDESQVPPRIDDVDWRTASLRDLANHIQGRHHSYLRAQLPRLGSLVDMVAVGHRQFHPELRILQRTLHAFVDYVVPHMLKEEYVVFPGIRRCEESGGHGAAGVAELRKSIELMEDEHETMGANLLAMRDLIDACRPPAEACRSWRVLFVGLEDLEADMQLHIHKENNILFPRAMSEL
jgi:regulator of cell morphogenesis and NO signaling